MQRRTAYKIIFGATAIGVFLCPIVLLFLPQSAIGTSQFMTHLPAFEKYQCVNCHVSKTPTPASHALNLFGVDFKANGYTWNQALAHMNSDRDRCSNGFELGDADGNGILDQSSSTLEHSNPGDPTDCSIAVTVQTWGIIKEIFSRETSVP